MRHILLFVFLAVVAAGCSRHRETPDEAPLPKGAVIQTLIGKGSSHLAFWLEEGEADAPEVRLYLTDGARYYKSPSQVMLDLRCDPWARGIIVGAGALGLGLVPPVDPPGSELVVNTAGMPLSGPVHPRNFGLTDISVPGMFIPADSIDLGRLATAKTVSVQWGARTGTFPTPPAAMLSDFTAKCSRAFRFGQWH